MVENYGSNVSREDLEKTENMSGNYEHILLSSLYFLFLFLIYILIRKF